jgi:hypothetical protein
VARQIKIGQPTHKGELVYRPTGRRTGVRLQESAHYWVTTSRAQYRKTDGKPKGCGPDPLWSLDLESVKLIGGLK